MLESYKVSCPNIDSSSYTTTSLTEFKNIAMISASLIQWSHYAHTTSFLQILLNVDR